MDVIIADRLTNAEGESPDLDFKATFDPSSTGDWCELVKDIVAFANSGGGWIVFGVNDDGTPSNADLGPLKKLDPAVVVDKIEKYTDQHFADFSLSTLTRSGSEVVAMGISGAAMPIVFAATGNYEVAGKQKNAFQKGTVYFRHGAKSEPGSTDDLRKALEREVDRVRSSWLDGIQKVVTAPPGSTFSVLSNEVRLSGDQDATSVRLVNDESAPAFKAMRTDLLYPHRQKELIAKVNSLISGLKITGHDVLCVRKAHGIDTNLTFFYKPQYSSPQYSDAFAEWIAQQHGADPDFFQKAREACKK
jgi:Putative DNA-binding domain